MPWFDVCCQSLISQSTTSGSVNVNARAMLTGIGLVAAASKAADYKIQKLVGMPAEIFR